MKKILTTCFMLLIAFTASAQLDTIYTRTEVIPCGVREITETSARFSYPNESLINTISLNQIVKIVFKSGRIQTFSNATSYKELTSPLQWNLVSIANTELEIQGLYKVGDVSSKAKGTTEFSNQERVRQRALDKIKVQAALLGGNIIHLSHMRSEGNKYGFWEDNTSESSVMGIAYASKLPLWNDVKDKIIPQKRFQVTESFWLANSNAQLKQSEIQASLYINDIREEHGTIWISGILTNDPQTEFRLSYFNESSFYIVYKTRRGIFSYKIEL